MADEQMRIAGSTSQTKHGNGGGRKWNACEHRAQKKAQAREEQDREKGMELREPVLSLNIAFCWTNLKLYVHLNV
jgi:hypothetical protein